MTTRTTQKGFTLVELIVVIAILAVLVAIGVPSLVKYIEDAKYTATLAEAKMVYNEVSMQMIVGDWTPGTAGSPYQPGSIRYELTKHLNSPANTDAVRVLIYKGPTDDSVNGLVPSAYQNHAKIAISNYLRITDPLKCGYRLYCTRTSGTVPSGLPTGWGNFTVTGMAVFCREPEKAMITGATPDYVFGTIP